MSNTQDYNNIEEVSKNHLFDKKLYQNLYQFIKPYRLRLSMVIVFVLVIVACELSIPLISKYIIDSFITVKYNLIKNNSEINFKNYPDLLFKLDEDHYLINTNEVSKLMPKDLKLLKASTNFDSQEKFYLVNPKVAKTLNQEQKLSLEKIGQHYIVDYQKLNSFDEEFLSCLRKEDILGIKTFGLIFVIIILANFIFTYSQVYIITTTGQKIMYDMRMALFTHIEKMPITFFDKNPIGVLVTRVTNDIENLNEVFTGILIDLIRNIFVLLTIAVIIFTIDIRLALMTFSVLPLVIIATYVFKKKLRTRYRIVRKAIAKINTILSEDIAGISVIQIFNREKINIKKFELANNDLFVAQKKQMLINAYFSPTMTLFRYIVTAFILYFASLFISLGSLSVGALVAFVAYVEKFFQPIRDISEKINLLQNAMASTERIFDLMHKEPEPGYRLSNQEKIENVNFQKEIRFKNVWFAYEKDNWVLKNFNLIIKKGENIALVGPTGAGKSSVINILNRFYEIQKGDILIDGVSIYDIPIENLRRIIGIVQQDLFVFSDTIRHNICFDQHISDNQLAEIGKISNVAKVVANYQNGYQHCLNEGGSSLSTGQKQLLAFGRLLAFNPEVMILDEATANIDTETELLIQETVNNIMDQKTSIIIAHRLSTIQHCDKIAVLKKGEIIEIGTHQQLLKNRQIYYNLYLLQYQ